LALRKYRAWLLLSLVVILFVANYFDAYYSSQLPPIPHSRFLTTPRRSMEPTLPSSQPPNQQEQPPSQQEPLESSKPMSPIIIASSAPYTSAQPASNLKLSVYTLDPSTNQFQPLTAIDWSSEGPIIPGQSRNSSRMYFKNEGNVPVTLYLSTSEWLFEDSAGKVLAQEYNQYFSLGWDYDNSTVAVNEARPVTCTLTISSAVVDVVRFSFDIVVTLTY
jgi:hypothetical protein